jgi:hypothetical protein
MNDVKLAINTEQDIGAYFRNELPEDVFKAHGGKLAKAAEGLFQWAAVACGFINSPASLGLSKDECIQRLLGHSRDGDSLLDNLYEGVLKEYFKTREAQVVFRSVMGQLLAAIEPLSISSLIALRRYAPAYDPEDSDRVLGILRYLGSLLSNVTSLMCFMWTLPIPTISWYTPALVWRSITSNLTSANSNHHISPTATSQTLNLELPNTFRLLYRMPPFTGTTIYTTFLSSTKSLGSFDPYSRRSFCFG